MIIIHLSLSLSLSLILECVDSFFVVKNSTQAQVKE